MSETKTVRVRVAVAVDPDGTWNAVGWSGAKDDDDMVGLALDMVGTQESVYWLTADLPLPATVEIPAEVTRDE